MWTFYEHIFVIVKNQDVFWLPIIEDYQSKIEEGKSLLRMIAVLPDFGLFFFAQLSEMDLSFLFILRFSSRLRSNAPGFRNTLYLTHHFRQIVPNDVFRVDQ